MTDSNNKNPFADVYLGNNPDERKIVDSRELYIDKLIDSEQDLKDIEEARKKIPSKSDRVIIRLLAALNVIVFVIVGGYTVFTGGGNAYSAIKGDSVFKVNDSYYQNEITFSDLSANIKKTEYPSKIQEKFKALYSVNSDTVAWVKAIGTSIDYVVTQNEDNGTYNKIDFYKKSTKRGNIFMDYRNTVGKDRDSLSKNTILYGHHLSAGNQMLFEDLEKYTDVEFYKEHPIILMDTIYNNYKWLVIGAFVNYPNTSSKNLFYYWYPDISDNNTVAFADEVKLRSYIVNPDIDIKDTDKFLTLSTCTYILSRDGFVDARFVVVCRLLRDGESANINVSNAYFNEDRRMPQLWYDQQGTKNPYKDTPVWVAY